MELYSFDDAYVQRLRAGDTAAQQHFVSYFSQLLAIKLRARYLSPDAIDDIRQETFARVFANLRKEAGLDHPERLGAYVNSVCNNVLFEQYRSKARTESLDDAEEPADKTVDLDRNLVSEDAKNMVSQVLESLSERDRRLLRAIFLEEKNKDQVCREFDIDRDYLRVLLHRAKLQFRAKYSESGFSKISVSK